MRSVQSTLFSLLLASTASYADTTLNLTQGVSPISHDIYSLHMTVFWICVVIGVGVFGTMLYAIIYHRKSRGVKPAEFHSHFWLEITWTIVPAIILIGMAIPATKVLFNINNEDQEDLTIKITGYQWKWQYEYLEDGIKFFSNLSTPFAQIRGQAPKGPDYLREVDKPLVVPVHKKIRFLITSNDVNHAWWVPDLAVKRDAVSGFINEAWTRIDKPGTYRGQCAELCGINHAYMPIVVVATSMQGYQDWVAQQKGMNKGDDVNKIWTKEELMKEGEQTYNSICAACHQPNGQGLPPTFPALKNSPKTTGPIATHIETVMEGVTGTAMQAFKNQLTDKQIAAVITYERNAWGHNTGDLLQPIQIKTLRDGKSMTEALAAKPTGVSATPKPVETAQPAVEQKAPSTSQAMPTASSVEPKAPQPVASAPVSASENATTTPPADPKLLKEAMARGEQVYLKTCVACHQPSGEGIPPTFPSLKGTRIVTGPVDEHIKKVMLGTPGTAMVAFKDQLEDQDIADVITYERNSWGNNTGTLVTPDEIKAKRQNTGN